MGSELVVRGVRCRNSLHDCKQQYDAIPIVPYREVQILTVAIVIQQLWMKFIYPTA
jgi:hypothetical protein